MSISLIKAEEVTQRFPDGTKSGAVELLFRDESERTVMRRVKVSSCATKVTKSLRGEATYQLVKAAKEAAIELGQKWPDVNLDSEYFDVAHRLILKGAFK